MLNTVKLIILIIMIVVGFIYSKKEKKAKEKETIDRNQHYRDGMAKSCIDYYRKIRELYPNKINEEYDKIARRDGIIRELYNVTWEMINNEINK